MGWTWAKKERENSRWPLVFGLSNLWTIYRDEEEGGQEHIWGGESKSCISDMLSLKCLLDFQINVDYST